MLKFTVNNSTFYIGALIFCVTEWNVSSCFIKKCFQKYRITHKKTPMLELLINKVWSLQPSSLLNMRLHTALSYESCKIFKYTFFIEHVQVTLSVGWACKIFCNVRIAKKIDSCIFETELKLSTTTVS